jgi:hypothetical protein
MRTEDRVRDPYRSKGKLLEPTTCPDCRAVYHKGRWQWLERPKGAHEMSCPACVRAHCKDPAGRVTIEGPFSTQHRQEILNLAKNLEKRAKAEHPLDRIMRIEEREDALIIETTDIHLPRALGEELRSAYQGELSYHYDEEEYSIAVRWER